MLVFVVYEEKEEQELLEQQFTATLVYEDCARCYVSSSLSADLLFELCPMLEEWQKVKGRGIPEGWLCRDMGERTKLFVNKRVEALFQELTSSFESPMDFAQNWDEVATVITKRLNAHLRICLDFTANKFYVILFSLFEALFTIFTLFVLANRPLFAATKQCKSAQKHLSTKLEIKSKQILNLCQRFILRCKGLVRNVKRRYKIVSDLSFYDTLMDDWP